MSIYIGDKEIKNLFVGGGISVSDMQGPAPDGFHVPLTTEWKAVKDARTALGGGSSDGTNFGIALKLPFAGDRLYSSAGVIGQGTGGFYWSSSRYNADNAYLLDFNSSALRPQNYYDRAYGFSVRCFKDSPVVPTSSWTKLYGTSIEAGGIFWSSADGLISLSSDGNTWITIQDKNLGATQVWNSGDALSEANCGKYYQWGNNYGFPRTGSVTTSGTQVDASTYGPGNYYSSSTFITRSSSPYRWDTTDNGNLRGGVSQGTAEKSSVKAVYLGDIKVRPPKPPRTFTISWAEQSNMSSGWTYSDDAAGLTAGSGDFDDFFGYSAVLLNTSGVETAEMTQSGGVFTGAMTTLGNITSGDNVMIKFPIRGIKMSKSGSVVTLSITEELNKTGYQYYAFNENGTQKDCLYLGAYKGTNSGGYLRSWSGTSSIGGISLNAAVSAANAYGGGYHEETYYARQLINAYYIMKYGNPNSQSVIGNGYVGGSSAQTTGATNSITNATGATNTGTTGRIKLFGLEDYWGNVVEFLDGARFIGGTNYLSTSSTQEFSSTGIITTFDKSMPTIPGYISSIVGTNDGMFIGYSNSSGSSSTYYCDYYNRLNGHWLCAGGFWSSAQEAGVFYIYNRDNANTHGANGARLMYL